MSGMASPNRALTTKARLSMRTCVRAIWRWLQGSLHGLSWSTGGLPLAISRDTSGRRCRTVFENFSGNLHIQTTLENMIGRERIPQTLLFAGMEGLGKATLARRFAARL